MTIQCVFASLNGPAIDAGDAEFGKKFSFSDEAHFDIGRYVNKQKCHIWRIKNPHAYIEKSTQPKRLTIWCGFWSSGIITTFFFEYEQGVAVTVNGDHYRATLSEVLFTKIKELEQRWVSRLATDLQTIPILTKNYLFEAHFDHGRYVNKQNYRIWGTKNWKRVTV